MLQAHAAVVRSGHGRPDAAAGRRGAAQGGAGRLIGVFREGATTRFCQRGMPCFRSHDGSLFVPYDQGQPLRPAGPCFTIRTVAERCGAEEQRRRRRRVRARRSARRLTLWRRSEAEQVRRRYYATVGTGESRPPRVGPVRRPTRHARLAFARGARPPCARYRLMRGRSAGHHACFHIVCNRSAVAAVRRAWGAARRRWQLWTVQLSGRHRGPGRPSSDPSVWTCA